MPGCELHIAVRVYESMDFIFLNSGNIAAVSADMEEGYFMYMIVYD